MKKNIQGGYTAPPGPKPIPPGGVVNKEMVTITKEEYDELKRDSFFLACLENAGVDNWEWYDEARTIFQEEYREEE